MLESTELDPEHTRPDQLDASLIITQLFHIIVCLEKNAPSFGLAILPMVPIVITVMNSLERSFWQDAKRLTELKNLKRMYAQSSVSILRNGWKEAAA